MDLSLITIGGPCKITDVSSVIYFEDDVTLITNPVEPQKFRLASMRELASIAA